MTERFELQKIEEFWVFGHGLGEVLGQEIGMLFLGVQEKGGNLADQRYTKPHCSLKESILVEQKGSLNTMIFEKEPNQPNTLTTFI